MSCFFSRFSRKRRQEGNAQYNSEELYTKCSSQVPRPSPSLEHQMANSGTESGRNSTLLEEPQELWELRRILQRTMGRPLSQQRAIQMNRQVPNQPRSIAVHDRARARSYRALGLRVTPVHQVDEDFDKEMAELAQLRSACLAYLCSVHGKERDPDGYVTVQRHRCYYVLLNRRDSVLVRATSHRLVKIDSLPPPEQNLHYETALTRAETVEEVRMQYEMQLCRLGNLRAEMMEREEAGRGMRRLGNRNYDAWANANSGEPKGATAIEDKADMAYEAGKRAYEVRLADAVAERGIMRLLERCEGILKHADPLFVPIVWLPESRKRWADARPGWTGLTPQDPSCGFANGEDSRGPSSKGQ